MTELALSVFFWLIATILVIICHRILKAHGIRTPKTLLIFLFGLLILTAVILFRIYQGGSSASMPLSAVLLYIALTVPTVTFLTTPVLGEQGPTSKILSLFRQRPLWRSPDIVSHFSDQEVYERRLKSLIDAGIARVRRGNYRLTERGAVVYRWLRLYSLLTGDKPEI